MNPRLLDGGMNILRRLEPLSVSLDLNLEPLSSAEMQLRPGDGIPDRSWVAIYTAAGLAGIFRSRPQQERYGERSTSVSLTHGAVELNDWLTGKSEEESSARADTVIRTIFNSYHGSVWTLGTVEPTQYIVYSLNNSGVLDALVDVMEQLPGYMLTFDQSVTPWTVNVVARPSEVTAEGRLSRNIQSVEISRDDSNLCTRVYYGDGNSYVQDAAAVQAYGVIEHRMSESGYTDAQLQTMAQTYLDNHKAPKLSVTISAIDLSRITGETLDQIRLGSKYRLTIPEDGVVIEQIICAIRYDDVFTGQPQITLSSDPETIITYLKQQRKSGRAGQSVKELEDKFKEFETWQTQTDETIETHAAQFVDILGDGTNEGRLTVAETVIGQTASDAYIVAQASGILLDQDGHPILDGQGHYQYDPSAADTTLISKLNVNATGISSLVSQTGAVSEIFDPEKPYSAGDKVIHRGVVYQFTANHQGQWTGTDVIEVQSLTSQISQNANGITSVVSQTGIITAVFDVNGLYNAGDKVLYQGVPYVFTERYTGGGWNPAIVQRINPLQTQITQTQTEISSKVSQSDLNTTLTSYLLISAFGTELGTTLQNGDTTLAAKIITAVNKNTNQSQVFINADQINLNGYVTATALDTRLLNVDSLFTTTGYAGTVNAGTVQTSTIHITNPEESTSPYNSYSPKSIYIGSVLQSMEFLGHDSKKTSFTIPDGIASITVDSNPPAGKIGFLYTTFTNSTPQAVNFNIAGTQTYIDGVSAARNSIEIAGYTWDVQSADSATAAHGKTYSIRLQNVTLGYQTGVDQHDDPVYTTTRTYNQIGPYYITDVYNQGWTDGNNDASGSQGGIESAIILRSTNSLTEFNAYDPQNNSVRGMTGQYGQVRIIAKNGDVYYLGINAQTVYRNGFALCKNSIGMSSSGGEIAPGSSATVYPTAFANYASSTATNITSLGVTYTAPTATSIEQITLLSSEIATATRTGLTAYYDDQAGSETDSVSVTIDTSAVYQAGQNSVNVTKGNWGTGADIGKITFSPSVGTGTSQTLTLSQSIASAWDYDDDADAYSLIVQIKDGSTVVMTDYVSLPATKVIADKPTATWNSTTHTYTLSASAKDYLSADSGNEHYLASGSETDTLTPTDAIAYGHGNGVADGQNAMTADGSWGTYTAATNQHTNTFTYQAYTTDTPPVAKGYPQSTDVALSSGLWIGSKQTVYLKEGASILAEYEVDATDLVTNAKNAVQIEGPTWNNTGDATDANQINFSTDAPTPKTNNESLTLTNSIDVGTWDSTNGLPVTATATVKDSGNVARLANEETDYLSVAVSNMVLGASFAKTVSDGQTLDYSGKYTLTKASGGLVSVNNTPLTGVEAGISASGRIEISLSTSIDSVSGTWDSTNYQYNLSASGTVKEGNTTRLTASGTGTLVPTDAINYGKSQVGLKTPEWLDSTDDDHPNTYLISTNGRVNSATGAANEEQTYLTPTDAITHGQNSVSAALVAVSAVPEGATSSQLVGGVYDLQRVVSGTPASHTYYTVSSSGGAYTGRFIVSSSGDTIPIYNSGGMSVIGRLYPNTPITSVTPTTIMLRTYYQFTYDGVTGYSPTSNFSSTPGATNYPTRIGWVGGDDSSYSAAIAAKPTEVTENGTYYAVTDNLDGYSSFVVNVSGGGGSSANIQTNKTVTYTANGSYTLLPSSGYDAMSRVAVTVNVPSGVTSQRTASGLDGTIVLPASHTGTGTISGNIVVYDDDSESIDFPVIIDASAVYQQGRTDGASASPRTISSLSKITLSASDVNNATKTTTATFSDSTTQSSVNIVINAKNVYDAGVAQGQKEHDINASSPTVQTGSVSGRKSAGSISGASVYNARNGGYIFFTATCGSKTQNFYITINA